MKCTQCNAPVKEDSGRFCSHCGTVLPDANRITPYEFRTHSDRFASVRKHTSYSQLMAASPSSGVIMRFVASAILLGMGVGAYLLINGFFAETGMSQKGSEKIFVIAFPLVIIAAGLVTLFLSFRYARAPLQRRIAVIIDERTKVQSSDERTTTKYYCTLQLEEGIRVEMSTTGKVAGIVTSGDIGVAYSKLDKLVDFKRVDV